MVYKILDNTDENIIKVEMLRYNAYGKDFPTDSIDNYYTRAIRKGEMLVFTIFIEKELCAACYVSTTPYTLFIEQLFVKKDYQNSGLRIGRKLLEYINFNKQIVEEYFKVPNLQTSKLSYTSEKSKLIYTKLGYKETHHALSIMSKHI